MRQGSIHKFGSNSHLMMIVGADRRHRTAAAQRKAAPIRVLAVASSGGHWVQLQRLRPAWDQCDVVYVSTRAGLRNAVVREAAERGEAVPRFYTVPDANRWQKARLIRQLIAIGTIFCRERPDIVISTGASLGYFALKVGKAFGARTIWVDSIANVDTISLSGQKAGSSADLWLTQWEHLAGPADSERRLPKFEGSVL